MDGGNMDRPELKSCPFCGSNNLKWGIIEVLSAGVECKDCSARGPLVSIETAWPHSSDPNPVNTIEEGDKKIILEAIEKWNSRSEKVQEKCPICYNTGFTDMLTKTPCPKCGKERE